MYEKDFHTEHYELKTKDHIMEDLARESAEKGANFEQGDFESRERRLVAKLDRTLLPILWILYLFNYLDRNSLTQARLNNFEKDLGLVGNQFNTAIAIINVGYMLMQLPSHLVNRLSIYRNCSGFHSLVVVRIFLGVAEAPFFPGAWVLLASWYTRRELALRTAVLYSGLVLASAFAGLVAAGVFAGLDGVRGHAGWQWLFILEGTGSFTAALVAFFLLPDFPDSKKTSFWFSCEDLDIAVERMRRDRVTDGDCTNVSVWRGLALAVQDIRTYIFVLILMSNFSAYGFMYFFPTILKAFNMGSTTLTLILTAPPFLLGTVASFFVAFFSDRYNERAYFICVPMAVAAIGFIISVATVSVPARYFASFLYTSGVFSANSIVFSWAASTLSQTPEKRACATAIINILCQFANIWSPYFFSSTDGPRYTMAMLTMMAFSILSICLCLLMRWILVRANRKLVEDGKESNQYTT